jgi:hypothetical protein
MSYGRPSVSVPCSSPRVTGSAAAVTGMELRYVISDGSGFTSTFDLSTLTSADRDGARTGAGGSRSERRRGQHRCVC